MDKSAFGPRGESLCVPYPNRGSNTITRNVAVVVFTPSVTVSVRSCDELELNPVPPHSVSVGESTVEICWDVPGGLESWVRISVQL